MKIALIVTDFPKVTETFILREVLALVAQGHQVRILHIRRFRRDELLHAFATPTLALAHHEPLLPGPRRLGSLARALRQQPRVLVALVVDIWRACWREPKRLLKHLALLPQAIAYTEWARAWGAQHLHGGFARYPGTTAWMMARLSDIPFSVSAHAHDIFVSQALLGPKLSACSVVRTISEYNREFLLRQVPGLDPARIAVVHCGLPVQSMHTLPAPPATGFHVVFVGALQQRKGVAVLLRAFAGLVPQTAGCRLTVVGDGPERVRLQRLASVLRLSAHVHFAGAQPNEALARWLAPAHVLVVPSIIGRGGRTEGIPVVLMEALAYQRPVVASRLTGIPELIRDGDTGLLVEPGSVAALQQALARVRDDPTSALAMAARGRRLIEAEFNLAHTGPALARLLVTHTQAPIEGRG